MTNLIENKQPAVVVCRDQIDALQMAMLALEPVPGFDTYHYFAGGMYCRKMLIPANTFIVSKVHKTEHLFIGCSGELAVSGQGKNFVLKSGDVIKSDIGTKRAVMALSDVVCITVHKTNLSSLEGLEEELIETDEMSLYDINNQLKVSKISQELK